MGPLRTIERLCSIKLVRVHTREPTGGGEGNAACWPRLVDGLIAELHARGAAGNRVRLIAVAASGSATGEVLFTATELRRLADAAHVEGVRVLVDAAQVVGNVPSHDVASLDVDYYCFGGEKGLRGPAGMGGLIMRAPGLSSCAAAPPPSVAPVISLGDVPAKDSRLQEAPVCTPGTRSWERTRTPRPCSRRTGTRSPKSEVRRLAIP